MFAEQKKDFYSVNADIAIEANQQQRNFEYNQRLGLIQQEYQSMGVSGNFEDSQNQTQDGLDQTYGNDPMQQELVQQQQFQMMMLDETMNGPQAIRYDEVYYPRTDKRSIKGNQYTYQGNEYYSKHKSDNAVATTVSNAIGNQEIGKSPIEYTNQLSRAKIVDMKNIRVPDQVRSYCNLYQDSIPMSSQHELQRYGKRAPGLDSSKRVNKAVFMNQIVQRQQEHAHMQQMQHYQQQQQQHQMNVEPVQEEQNQEQENGNHGQEHQMKIPDGGLDDDNESAATEVAEAQGADVQQEDQMQMIVEQIWKEYDQDNSGYLDKQEMVPLAEKALNAIGYTRELDKAACDAFFAEIDDDGNGKVSQEELKNFLKTVM